VLEAPQGEEAGVNALLNDATEFLQYARGITGLLVEALQDDEDFDKPRIRLALGAINALVVMGVQCASRAHLKMEWDRA
jgi:hypothetical protein